MTGSWIRFAGQYPTYLKTDSLIYRDLIYLFVHGFPGSRLFKMTFPESRFVKLPNPVSRSKLQSRISLPIFSKIPNPGLQKSQIPDPEKPIGDPLCSLLRSRFLGDKEIRYSIPMILPNVRFTEFVWEIDLYPNSSLDKAEAIHWIVFDSVRLPNSIEHSLMD